MSHDLTEFRDCTDANGPGTRCQNCLGNRGETCKVSPRSSDPQTGDMCGTCYEAVLTGSCLHSPKYGSNYDIYDYLSDSDI